MQQYLIPLKTGDERLLMPGWAGDLTDPELEFVYQQYMAAEARFIKLELSDRESTW